MLASTFKDFGRRIAISSYVNSAGVVSTNLWANNSADVRGTLDNYDVSDIRSGSNSGTSIAYPNGGGSTDDRFGFGIAADDSYMIASSYAALNDKGKGFLYNKGIFEKDFRGTGLLSGEKMGTSMALSKEAERIVACAKNRKVGNKKKAGECFVFDFQGVQQPISLRLNAIPGSANIVGETVQNGFFGQRVKIFQDHIYIGSIGRTSSTITSGAVYIFKISGTFVLEVLPEAIFSSDRFGSDFTLLDSVLAISAPDQGTCGVVYLFTLKMSGASPTDIESSKIIEPSKCIAGMRFGNARSMAVLPNRKLILIGNGGSDSEKYNVVDVINKDGILKGHIDGSGNSGAQAFGSSIAAIEDVNNKATVFIGDYLSGGIAYVVESNLWE